MQHCKVCNTLFKNCNGCKLNSLPHNHGYCCSRCMRQDLEGDGFEKELLDVLVYGDENITMCIEESREVLWECWVKQEHEKKYRG